MERDPEAAAAVEHAAAALAEVEAEVEAERRAEAEEPQPTEPLAGRLAEVQQRLEELDQRLAAFSPVDAFKVDHALERVRSLAVAEPVPVPEALALADELVALEAQLVASGGLADAPGALAEGRNRLDDARQALLEAEQAVRSPDLDRAVVDRLEHAHADLLDAIDKAERRFGGARAQHKVDALRAAEHALLDEMGFTSYSDYMMGISLLHVDPEKEAALDAARVELAAAEDAWRSLQEETDAELARAEVMERRRGLLDAARDPPRALASPPAPSSGSCARCGSMPRSRRRSCASCATRWRTAAWPSTTRPRPGRPRGGRRGVGRRGRARRSLGSRSCWRSGRPSSTSAAAAAAALEAAVARADGPPEPTAEEQRTARLEAARAQAAGRRGAPPRPSRRRRPRWPRSTTRWPRPPKPSGSPPRRPSRPIDAVATAAAEGEALLVELRRIEQELEAATHGRSGGERPAPAALRGPMATSSPDWLAEAEAAYRADQAAAAETERALVELAAQRQQATDAAGGRRRCPARAAPGGRGLRGARRSSGTSWPGWPPSDPASLGGSLPLLARRRTRRPRRRTSSTMCSVVSSGWPRRCRSSSSPTTPLAGSWALRRASTGRPWCARSPPDRRRGRPARAEASA